MDLVNRFCQQQIAGIEAAAQSVGVIAKQAARLSEYRLKDDPVLISVFHRQVAPMVDQLPGHGRQTYGRSLDYFVIQSRRSSCRVDETKMRRLTATQGNRRFQCPLKCVVRID